MVPGLYVHLNPSWIVQITAAAGPKPVHVNSFLSMRFYGLIDQST